MPENTDDILDFNPRSAFAPDQPLASEAELRAIAADLVKFCPSLTHLLLALGSTSVSNPLRGMN